MLKKYPYADPVKKIAGVGIVRTHCWVVFLTGIDSGDPLFLQIKEAQPSVLEQFAGKSVYTNHGERIVVGQRLIQGAPDIFLGWGEQDGVHFYVRQLRDMKGGVEFERGKLKLQNLPDYCRICGWALALAHAKSGDAALLAGYAGKSDELDEAITRFAFSYADQNEKDYNALVKAAKRGRIKFAEAAS